MGEYANIRRNDLLNSNKNHSTLKFASLNVCGLKTRLQYPDFIDYFKHFDIVCSEETKIDDMDIISFPGFKLISQPRKEPLYLRKSGGLAIFIKDNLANYCKPLETESDYILWLKRFRGSYGKTRQHFLMCPN